MQRVQTAVKGSSETEEGGATLSAAALFAIVWERSPEVLGTAATAAIVRRAAGRAAVESPELVDLVIVRENLEYRYTAADAWSHTDRAATPERAGTNRASRAGRRDRAAAAGIDRNRRRRRLEQIPELRAGGLLWRPKEAN